MAGNVKISHCWIDGKPVSISFFAENRGKRDLPVPYCPECGGQLTAKPGQGKRQPHFAHKSDAQCPTLQSRETLLHQETKNHIACVLRENLGADILIVERCCENKAHDCAQEQVRGLGIEWSNVRVEQRLIRTGARIPDVSLCFGEDLVLAIEVHVSNAVDATKAHDYDSRGVRWVEVEGSERIFAKPKWAIALPLPIENTNITRNWVCGECLKEIESQRRLQEYMARARARMEAEARQLPARKQISGESRKQVLQASSEVQKDSPLPVSSQSLPSKEPSLLKKWPSDVSAAAQVVDEMVVELRYRGTHPTDLRYHTPKPVQLRYQIVQATANGEPCFWLDERTSIGEKLPLGKENALLTANKIDALKSLCSDRLAQWERDGFEIMEVSRWKHADTPRTKTGSE